MSNINPIGIYSGYALPTKLVEQSPRRGYQCADLKQLEATHIQTRIRRIGRNTRMALCGAVACIQQSTIQPNVQDMGIFLGTALGPISELLYCNMQMTPALNLTPSPIRFSNSVSNAAPFTIAKHLGSVGTHVTLAQEDHSFEAACLSAMLSLQTGDVKHALVGGCDEFVIDTQEWNRQHHYPNNSLPGEGSGWLLLGPDSPAAHATLLQIEWLPVDQPWKALTNTLASLRHEDEPLTYLQGLRITDTAQQALPQGQWIEYLPETGWFPTASSYGILYALQQNKHTGLTVHLCQNALGRNVACIIRQRASKT
ncbi:MAG: hypothetical protein CL920_25205 [Deltaproteobacteria bacterium]|nr:hypothetical protein [Deltaproteobacteria bacterium]MBU52004.1 hypothetical protein [Deltaproteobacteria bacterium]